MKSCSLHIIIVMLCLNTSKAQGIPRDLGQGIDALRLQLNKSTDSLFEGWLSAAAAHPQSGGPAFRAASKQISEIRQRVVNSLETRKIIWVDKGAFAADRDIRTPHYYYRAAEGRVNFTFPFAAWDETVIVMVWDSRFKDYSSIGAELRRDYLLATIDNLISLTSSTVYRELRVQYPEQAAEITLHVFGPWYGAQSISQAEGISR